MRALPFGARRIATVVAGLSLVVFAVDALAVDEIFVTTRKRAENLQKVPIAVQAITADEIERRGITSLKAITEQSASIILDQGFAPQDQRIVIRGLSPSRGRQNVAVLVDDIDVSSEAIGTFGGSLLINPRLFDLERVEVVKGPQNALYGRSAFNGAINYITKKPGEEFEGRVGTDIGSDGMLEITGGVSGPVTDSISAGLAAMTWNRDGFYDNAFNGEEMGDQDGWAAAATGVWKVTSNFSATARVERLDDHFGVTPYAVMPFNASFRIPDDALFLLGSSSTPAPTPADCAADLTNTLCFVPGVKGDTPDGDSLEATMDPNPRNGKNYPGTDREVTRGTLTLEWDLGAVALKSLTHYASANVHQIEGAEDVDASTATAVGELDFKTDTDLFSQELRLTSNNEGAFNWTVGALYWDEEVKQKDGSFTCLDFSGTPCGPSMAQIGSTVPLNADNWFRDTEHWSVYGLIDWQFVPDFHLILEGRYTNEDGKVGGPDVDNALYDPSGTYPCAFGPPFTPCPQLGPGTLAGPPVVTTVAGITSAKTDDDFFAPKVTLQWSPTDSQMYYVSVAQAFKPAGIGALNSGVGAFEPEQNRFKQEELINYEIGAKTSWMDNRVRANGAVFYEDFTNKQVSTQVVIESNGVDQLVPRLTNAGAAEVLGSELELSWYATDNISMGLSWTHLWKYEYTDFTVFSRGRASVAYAGNCTDVTLAGTRGCYVNYKGNHLEDAPEDSLVLNARYQASLVGATDWFVEGDANYQSERYDNQDNQLVFPDYWLANFRAGITNEQWDIAAYVDNAFDDDTIKTGFADGDIPLAAQTGFAVFANHGTLIKPDPRTYGLRVNYRFGK